MMEPVDDEAVEQMLDAVEEGSLEEVQGLVQQDRRLLVAANEAGLFPLLLAAIEGHLPVVQYLLDEGANVHQADFRHITALHEACTGGHTPVVALLLERGADPAAPGPNGTIPLIRASFKGHVGVVELLTAHGCGHINHQDGDGRTALHWASYSGYADVVRVLLEKGADLMLDTDDGDTARDVAVMWNQRDVMQLLEEWTSADWLLFKARRLRDVTLGFKAARTSAQSMASVANGERAKAVPRYLATRKGMREPLPKVEVRGGRRRRRNGDEEEQGDVQTQVLQYVLGDMRAEVFTDWQRLCGWWRA